MVVNVHVLVTLWIYAVLIRAPSCWTSRFLLLCGDLCHIPALALPHQMHTHSQTRRRLLNQQPLGVFVLGELAQSHCAAWEAPYYSAVSLTTCLTLGSTQNPTGRCVTTATSHLRLYTAACLDHVCCYFWFLFYKMMTLFKINRLTTNVCLSLKFFLSLCVHLYFHSAA